MGTAPRQNNQTKLPKAANAEQSGELECDSIPDGADKKRTIIALIWQSNYQPRKEDVKEK
jgi:hypothetical protein